MEEFKVFLVPATHTEVSERGEGAAETHSQAAVVESGFFCRRPGPLEMGPAQVSSTHSSFWVRFTSWEETTPDMWKTSGFCTCDSENTLQIGLVSPLVVSDLNQVFPEQTANILLLSTTEHNDSMLAVHCTELFLSSELFNCIQTAALTH